MGLNAIASCSFLDCNPCEAVGNFLEAGLNALTHACSHARRYAFSNSCTRTFPDASSHAVSHARSEHQQCSIRAFRVLQPLPQVCMH